MPGGDPEVLGHHFAIKTVLFINIVLNNYPVPTASPRPRLARPGNLEVKNILEEVKNP